MTPETTQVVDELYRDRIRSLKSVDDLVEAVVNELKVTTTLTHFNEKNGERERERGKKKETERGEW